MRYIIVSFFVLSYGFCQAQVDSVYVSDSFTDSAKVYFSIPKSEKVLIGIYNKLGANVATIINDSTIHKGAHTLYIHGQGLEAGTYIAGFIFGNKQIVHQILKENSPTSTVISPIVTSSKKPLRCSPNPTRDSLYIPVNGFKNIYILTLSGQVVKYITSEVNTIPIKDVPPGNYIVRINGADTKQVLSDYIMVLK
jgi:hypothetical protein